MIKAKDRQLLKEMSKAISYYLKAASYLSDETFNELSKNKGLYWSELKEQRDVIEKIIDEEKEQNTVVKETLKDREDLDVEETLKDREDLEVKETLKDREDLEVKETLKDREDLEVKETLKDREDLEVEETLKDREDLDVEEALSTKEDIVKNSTENAPVMLYDAMVKFLKKQNIIEHHWVNVYYVKSPQQDNKDFEIKYYEHKDKYAVHKNYISFGDIKKSYSIKKQNGEVVGDTEECFNYILNLRDKLGIE